MVNIYIVRHAESTGNVEKRLTGRVDYPLTNKGINQAKELANKLKQIHFDKIYSSPYQRTINTVKELAKNNNLEIILEEDFSEMFFGIYDGFKWEEVNKIEPKIDKLHKTTNEIMEIPNQETTDEVAKRMYNKIDKISKENRNKNILIASHGVAIEAFLRKITKEPFITKVEEYSQKNTSINIIQYDETKGIYNVKVLNNIKLN